VTRPDGSIGQVLYERILESEIRGIPVACIDEDRAHSNGFVQRPYLKVLTIEKGNEERYAKVETDWEYLDWLVLHFNSDDVLPPVMDGRYVYIGRSYEQKTPA
jgi:hypothetical protein